MRLRQAGEFPEFLRAIEAVVLARLDVHLVWTTMALTKPFRPNVGGLVARAFMRTHADSASGLNQVEPFFAILTQKQIRRGTPRSTIELKKAIRSYLNVYNQNQKPFM